MRKFKNYGISCSVNGVKGYGNLEFNTTTCKWSAKIYPTNHKAQCIVSRSYRKVCVWFSKQLKKYDIK